MTDLEKAVAKWLPELLNEPCPFCDDRHHSLIVATPELGFRLLEAMTAKGYTVCFSPRWTIIHDKHGTNVAEAGPMDIIKAAAALAKKEQP